MSAFSREIRSFVTVSQCGSIRSAAEQLNISAPALSRQIKILERSYGTALLVRSAGGIALTAEGEALRDEALRWMADDAAFSKRLRQDSNDGGLTLRLGIMEGLIETLIPPLVERLEQIYSTVELELAVGTTSEILKKAETADLDLIVAFNMPRLSRLIVVDSQEYHLGAVHAPGFGPAGSGPVSLSEAMQCPLCLPGQTVSMHTRLIAEILSEKVNPQVRVSSNSISVLLNYMRSGKGVGFLTWPDIARDAEAGRLIFRPLLNKRLTETLSIGISRANSLGDATGLVVNEIRAALKALGK